MTDRFTRLAMAVALVLLGAIAAQPYIERLVFAVAAPQPVAPRGDLAESEKSTIEVFERVAPSVVQVVSLTGRTQQMGGRQGVSSGTGFVSVTTPSASWLSVTSPSFIVPTYSLSSAISRS